MRTPNWLSLAALASVSAFSIQTSAFASTALLDAIAAVESGGANVPGDGGRAVGVMQLHRKACADMGARHAEAWQPDRAREIAAAYVAWISGELRERLRREPSPGEIYASYNMGLRGFANRGCRLDRCPRVTRERAAMVQRIVADAADAAWQRGMERRFTDLCARNSSLLTLNYSLSQSIAASEPAGTLADGSTSLSNNSPSGKSRTSLAAVSSVAAVCDRRTSEPTAGGQRPPLQWAERQQPVWLMSLFGVMWCALGGAIVVSELHGKDAQSAAARKEKS